MPMAQQVVLNVENDAAIALTNKLESLHRSAFPVAVRTALNSAAFDVKQRTMPKESKSTFEERKKNFFKANSRVDMAKGFDVRSMQSVVGFKPLSGNNKAVDELEQQERGGTIGGRSFIPMDTGRTSKSHSKNVSAKNRVSVMPNVVSARKARASSAKRRFIKSVVHAGKGGVVLSESIKGTQILWRINNLQRQKGSRKWKLKLTALHSFEKSRKVKVKATHFMERASEVSGAKIERFYAVEANRQFKKYGIK